MIPQSGFGPANGKERDDLEYEGRSEERLGVEGGKEGDKWSLRVGERAASVGAHGPPPKVYTIPTPPGLKVPRILPRLSKSGQAQLNSSACSGVMTVSCASRSCGNQPLDKNNCTFTPTSPDCWSWQIFVSGDCCIKGVVSVGWLISAT